MFSITYWIDGINGGGRGSTEEWAIREWRELWANEKPNPSKLKAGLG